MWHMWTIIVHILEKNETPQNVWGFSLTWWQKKHIFPEKSVKHNYFNNVSHSLCKLRIFTCQPKMCKNRWNFAQTSEQPWNERKWNQNPKRKDISLGHFGQRIWKLALMVDGQYTPFRWWCGTFYVLICIFCHARKFSRILSFLSDKVLWVVEISEEEENISFV